MSRRRSLASLLVLSLLMAARSAAAGMTVEDAWVAEPPPGALAAGGFMKLENEDERPRKLLRVESSVCQRVELHRSVVEKGVARMIRLEEIAIPARSTVILRPGGYHLMLVHPVSLRLGARVELTLVFDGGEKRVVRAAVRALEAEHGRQR